MRQSIVGGTPPCKNLKFCTSRHSIFHTPTGPKTNKIVPPDVQILGPRGSKKKLVLIIPTLKKSIWCTTKIFGPPWVQFFGPPVVQNFDFQKIKKNLKKGDWQKKQS